MPHPIMFRDDDFGLRRLRAIALGFAEAFEKVSWGRPAFCAPKMFAIYGGNAKTGAAGELTPHPYSLLVKVDESDRRALAHDDRFFFPPIWDPPAGWGWISWPGRWTGRRSASSSTRPTGSSRRGS
jgi:hypothetical protein